MAQLLPPQLLAHVQLQEIQKRTGMATSYRDISGVAYRAGNLFLTQRSTGRILVCSARQPALVQQEIPLAGRGITLEDICYAQEVDRLFVLAKAPQHAAPVLMVFDARLSPRGDFFADRLTSHELNVQSHLPSEDQAAQVEGLAVNSQGSELWVGLRSANAQNAVLVAHFTFDPACYRSHHLWGNTNPVFKEYLPLELGKLGQPGSRISGLAYNPAGLYVLLCNALPSQRPRENQLCFIPWNGGLAGPVVPPFGNFFRASGVADTPTALYVVFGDSTQPDSRIAAIPKLAAK